MDESQVFTRALKIADSAERAAFLEAACSGRPHLRADVEALLRAHERDPSFLEVPCAEGGTLGGRTAVGVPSGAAPTFGTQEQPGILLAGRYELLEALGEGGMGSVWLAQQIAPVRRRVAVKLIKAGMDSSAVLARFEAERQALALMEHPNIARVFDAGTTSDGRPFFAMELVQGLPITRYCDNARLTPRQRLELFLPVCQAIQHAHQKGVIHRDIKPSNVLVALGDDRPVPKVIDFGVAKATGPSLTEQSVHTSLGSVVGTLEYMSPEQAGLDHLDVDTRSDIYALGVLLYELLAGSPPFFRRQLAQQGVLEILRFIREQEPPRPSTRLSTAAELPALAAQRATEPQRLAELLRGELDWIVMKALEKDRNRRYETASAFEADVRRYLEDEPVLACPPSVGYRLGKFARRHQRALAMAALLAVMAVVAVAALAVSYVRVDEALASETNARRHQGEALAAEKKARGDLQEAFDRETDTVYFQNILLSDREWLDHNVDRARVLLDSCPHEKRHWEWDYLRRRGATHERTLMEYRESVASRGTLSADGSQAALCRIEPSRRGWDVLVLDTSTGKTLHTLPKPDSGNLPVAQFKFSADGKVLVGADQQTVIVWDLVTARHIVTAPAPGKMARFLAVSKNGKQVFSSHDSGVAYLWDGQTGKLLREIRGDGKGCILKAAAFNSTGSRLAVCCQVPYGVLIFDTASGKQLLKLPVNHLCDCLDYNYNGSSLAVASQDGQVSVWNALSAQNTANFNGHSARIVQVAFVPKQKLIATASTDRSIKVWNSQGRAVHTFRGHRRPLLAIAFSKDGSHLTSLGTDQAVHHWDLDKSQDFRRLTKVFYAAEVLSFSPDGQQLALGPVVFDVPNGRELLQLPGVRRATFSPDGKRLLTLHEKEDIQVREAGTGQVLKAWRSTLRDTVAAQFSPDGRHITSASADSVVRLWDAGTGELLRSVARQVQSFGTPLTLSPDGKQLAVISAPQRTIRVLEASSDRELWVLRGHTDRIWRLTFSPDSRSLASGSDDGTLKIWDLETGELRHNLTAGPSGIHGVAYSPDGKRLASVGTDDMLRIWDPATGRLVLDLHSTQQFMQAVTFSPDGRLLVTQGSNGVDIWDGTPIRGGGAQAAAHQDTAQRPLKTR